MIPLHTVLRINSVFSIISGAALALGAEVLDEVIGVAALWLVGIGIGVVVFGVIVGRVAAQRPVARKAAGAILAADLAWVFGAAVLIFGLPDLLSTAGKWTLGVISLFVLDFATLQAFGLARTGTMPDADNTGATL